MGGHSLNRAPDPVMSAPELTAMLEELGFVPQCVSRQDVVEVFRAVMQVCALQAGVWGRVSGRRYVFCGQMFGSVCARLWGKVVWVGCVGGSGVGCVGSCPEGR